ncbi:MAG: hypothetical protein HDT21_04045 [Ruminococcus sp.]|nr:hypothetical protein [Ruminococcus sp.]
MRKKRFAVLLAAVFMVLGFAGCLYNEIPANQDSSETTSAAADEIDFHYVTDWSLDDMVQSIEMNGVTYSMPFTLNDLGNKYSLEWVGVDFEENGKVDHYTYVLKYCDMVYAGIEVFDPFDFNDMDNYKITSIILTSDTDFKFGGVDPESTKDNILEKFGEPSYISSDYNMFAYMFDGGDDNLDSSVVVGFNDDNEMLKVIAIRYYK